MERFEDNLITLKTLESRFGEAGNSIKLLQIFEILNKLKFYMKNVNNIQKELYIATIANLRIAIEEELKNVSSDYVRE